MTDGEKRQVLDIRVMFCRIRDDMVNVVAPFPPAQAEATKEIGYDDTDDGVDMEVVGYAHMASIVGGKDKLMPETAEEESRRTIPTQTEKEVCQASKEGVATAFDKVRKIVALVQSSRTDLLV